MIRYDRYQTVLTQSDAAVRAAAEKAFQALLDKIRAGSAPRAAIDAILRKFNADALEGFRDALDAILQSSLGLREIKAYSVGRVKLSDALYANAQAVSAVSRKIIETHMQGLHDARELRKALYEGYNFQDDPLHVVKPLPKYLQVAFDKAQAAKLKTPALRAAYLDAIRQAEAGAGMADIEKKLKIAFYERNRYYANRIARTELHRNYTDQAASEIMADRHIEYVQIRMSSKHPKTDICDFHAKADLYGLGPGIYPKAAAPKPPFHPFCQCRAVPKIDLFDVRPRFNPKAERMFLARLPPDAARQIAGSSDKLARVLKGDVGLESIYNEGKDPLYQWQRLGEAAQDKQMGNPKSIADPATIRQFLESNRSDPVPVAVLPADIRKQLGVDTDRVLLSRYTADKQRKHPEITSDSYGWLQDLLDQGQRISGKPFHVVVIQRRGEWFVAVLKATQAGDEVYLQSFRRSDAKDIAKLRGERKK